MAIQNQSCFLEFTLLENEGISSLWKRYILSSEARLLLEWLQNKETLKRSVISQKTNKHGKSSKYYTVDLFLYRNISSPKYHLTDSSLKELANRGFIEFQYK
ncbi:MAG: hypothetical protein H7A25_14775 [Leptospiraceae bacterium]|nr:hypothetical protein [Leptospiraceae bacterium]MCP5501165.1 hypothetical protein [Leptospiraceae bacterium]